MSVYYCVFLYILERFENQTHEKKRVQSTHLVLENQREKRENA